MNGAEALVRSLAGSGIDVCFANPGTSEMHFVAALDRLDLIYCVLALQENVATGAADAYARMSGLPAATLLHLGPGFGNGLANVHNARKARVPMVNIVGEHASYHIQYDAPLTSDIQGIVGPVSDWVVTSETPDDVGADAAMAVAKARSWPGKIATMILPADMAWSETGLIGGHPGRGRGCRQGAEIRQESRHVHVRRGADRSGSGQGRQGACGIGR
jgi:acetolactate synthase I/II/III large subunit